MHSPILYMTSNKNEIYDLSIPDEKDKFLQDNFPSELEYEFDQHIPKSDWWELNTTDDEEWSRGQWDVEEVLHNIFNGIIGHTDMLERKGNIIKVTIDEEISHTFYKYVLDKIEIAYKRLSKIDKEDYEDLNMNIGMFQYLVKESTDMGVVFIETDIEQTWHGAVMNAESFLNDQMYDENKTKEYYIYTLIQGDYHY